MRATAYSLPKSSAKHLAVSAFLFAGLVPLGATAQPAAPAGLLATAGDEQATLTWQDPSNSNIVRYEFRFGAGEAPEFNAWAEVPGSGADTVEHTVSGLANGTRYAFELRALDGAGAGEAASAATKLAVLPGHMIHVPDEQLRRLILQNLERYADITQGNMAKLRELRDPQRGWISDLAGLEFAINLVTLDLRDNEISDISPLSGLTSLGEIDLSDNQIVDIAPLSALTLLRVLDLSGNKISDVSGLSSLTSLSALYLSRNEISNVSPLSSLISLRLLALSSNEILDVSRLSGLTSLRHLYLSHNKISDVSGLSGLTSLSGLYLSRNEMADVSPLSGLISLQELWLSGNDFADISPLSSLTSLRFLYLGDIRLSDVSPLSGLTSLRVLDLGANEISDISPLSDLTSLTELWMGDNAMSNLSLSNLTSLTALRRLDLSLNEISDVTPLSGVASLRYLFLRDNALADIAPLSDLTSLESLDLSGNDLTDVSALLRLTELMTLDLSRNKVTNLSALPRLAELTTLNLSSNKLAHVSLSDLPSLTTLDLAGNPLSSVSLSGLTSLTDLDLSGHAISRISLAELTSLRELDLSENELSDISSLSDLTSLNTLRLHGNQISDISALSGLTSVSSIGLVGNEIVDIAPLSRLTSLWILELSKNKIADVSPLSGLTSLNWLYLSSNEVSDVSPLSRLFQLSSLDLSDNQLSDVSPLSDLWRLASLDLSGNELSDVSPLSRLTSLRWLELQHNEIADVSPLSGVNSLEGLWLDGNAISDLSALGSLGELSFLVFKANAVADISPLLESGLPGPGNYVDVRGNPLDDGQADHVRALRDVGTAVAFDDGGHRVPLFPSAAAGSWVTGFVRVINHSNEAGSVAIEAVDETGRAVGTSLPVNAGQALHFNARDLEQGDPDKGLRGVGEPAGDWRLTLRSELDIEVLGYGRTPDGFVTSLHDLVSEAFGVSNVPTFNPGSNRRQVSRLRLLNPSAWDREGEINAGDDAGVFRRRDFRTPAGRTLDVTAAQLESGDGIPDFAGIGDGSGKWRLYVDAPGQRVLSLLQSPTVHLANISTGTAASLSDRAFYSWAHSGRYRVPLFLARSNEIQGFLRIVIQSSGYATIELRVFDGSGVERDPVVLKLKGSNALHFNSEDLELGNAAKGLPGFGAPAGDWHLEVSADRRFEVLAYARTADGFVTSMHDVAPRLEDGSLWIPFFNPGRNRNQISRLRLVNWGETAAEATIEGVDDAGDSPGEAVRVTVPARSARDYTARELETGQGAGLSGALGEGTGKWRLRVSSAGDIEAMSLLGLPTGHITNLSTTPRFPPN